MGGKSLKIELPIGLISKMSLSKCRIKKFQKPNNQKIICAHFLAFPDFSRNHYLTLSVPQIFLARSGGISYPTRNSQDEQLENDLVFTGGLSIFCRNHVSFYNVNKNILLGRLLFEL